MGKSCLTVQMVTLIHGIHAALLAVLFSLLKSVFSNIEQHSVVNNMPVLKLQ